MFMQYNIHPILVHFPIAFFLLYSLLRILPFQRWLPKVSWQHIRLVVLVAGVLGAMAASATGELAEELVRPDHRLVETHAFFASASTWIYVLLLVGEILFVINPYLAVRFFSNPILKIFTFFERILTNKFIAILLAVLGVLAITLTGLLGGAMVYGTSADPLAPFVLKMLGLHL